MPTLAILTDSLRYDNHYPLRYFRQIKPVHFYNSAPYGDVGREELKGEVKYQDFQDLERRLMDLKPDIIQGAEPYGSRTQLRLCYLAWKISRRRKIPLIFPMLENRPVEKRFGAILGPIMRWTLAIYAKQAKLIFYLNNGAKRNLLEAGVESSKLKKLLYGVWGVDTAVFRPLKPKTYNLKPTILFVGRLDEAKGIPYLLEAWEKIRQEFPEIELVMAGKGEMEEEIRKKKYAIRYKGMVKTQDLPKYFQEALFTVYPSVTLKRWEEQVGTVNLQSLACGTPVITTKSGAIPEYVNDKVGILVPERDSTSLYQAMKKLLTDEDYRLELAQSARPYILDNFDAKKTVEKTEEILLGLTIDK